MSDKRDESTEKPGALMRVTKAGAGVVKGTLQTGIDGIRTTVDLANDGIDAVSDGIGRVRQGISSSIDAVTDIGKAFVADLRRAIDIRTQIEALQPGDRYIIQLGASGSAEGVKVYGQGQIVVERRREAFVVSSKGDMGGGLFRELGGRLGQWKAGLTGEVLLGGGMGVEMSFATASEAHRTIEILLKLSAISSVGRAIENIPLSDKVLPETFRGAFQLTEAEKEFLLQQASASIWQGQLVFDLAAALGGPGPLSALSGILGQGQNKESIEARVEYDAHGNATALVLTGEISQELAWTQEAAVAFVERRQNGISLALSQRFRLPPTWSQTRAQEGFIGALRKLGAEIAKTREDRLVLRYDQIGDGDPISRTESKFVFRGEWGDLFRKELIQLGWQREFEQMLSAAGEHLHVEASVSPFTTTGLQLTPFIGLMGVGAGVDIQARRELLYAPGHWHLAGNANDIAKEVHQRLSRGLRLLVPKNPKEADEENES